MRMKVHFFYVFCVTVTVYSADIKSLDDSFSKAERDIYDSMMASSFHDFICGGIASHRKRRLFIHALAHRPELAHIDWERIESGQLADELWRFQTLESDRGYHLSLVAAMKTLMKFHGVPPEKMKRVLAIIAKRARAHGTNQYKKSRKMKMETEEEKEARRQKKRIWRWKRETDMHRGLGKPLLQYIRVENPKSKSPTWLHEEALKYRHMYSSSLSFILKLREMWRILGLKDYQVFDQNHDRRNFHSPGWNHQDSHLDGSISNKDDGRTASASSIDADVTALYGDGDHVASSDDTLQMAVHDKMHLSSPLASPDALDPTIGSYWNDTLDQDAQIVNSWSFEEEEEPFPCIDNTTQQWDESDDVIFPDWDQL